MWLSAALVNNGLDSWLFLDLHYDPPSIGRIQQLAYNTNHKQGATKLLWHLLVVAFKNGKNCSIFKILINGRIIDLILREKTLFVQHNWKSDYFVLCHVPHWAPISVVVSMQHYAVHCRALMHHCCADTLKCPSLAHRSVGNAPKCTNAWHIATLLQAFTDHSPVITLSA